jgi:hypothetical protein
MNPGALSRPFPRALLSIFLTAALLLPAGAFAGGAGVGGGDECGKRFEKVAGLINKWIDDGGPKNLKYRDGLTANDYDTRMKKVLGPDEHGDLKGFDIECVAPGDKHYPVDADDSAKECINFKGEDDKIHIRCDLAKFYSSKKDPDNDAGQFEMVHHELVSAAGLEPHDGPKSTYFFTNQISAFVSEKLEKYLAIQPHAGNTNLRLTKIVREPQTSSRNSAGCLESVHTVRAFDANGKPRLELRQENCFAKNYQAYVLHLIDENGVVTESHGFGLPPSIFHDGKQPDPNGEKLSQLFESLNTAKCVQITQAPDHSLVGSSACPWGIPLAEPAQNHAPAASDAR